MLVEVADVLLILALLLAGDDTAGQDLVVDDGRVVAGLLVLLVLGTQLLFFWNVLTWDPEAGQEGGVTW